MLILPLHSQVVLFLGAFPGIDPITEPHGGGKTDSVSYPILPANIVSSCWLCSEQVKRDFCL